MPMPSNAHLNWHPFLGICRHDYIVPPAPPTVWWFLDADIVNGVTGLFAWPTAEFPYPPARRPSHGEVLDMSVPMQGNGTDATLLVPHVPIPPLPGPLLPLIILMGSSKIIMASSRTRVWCKGMTGLQGEQELAVGCCVFPYFPLSLNLQCWDFACKKFDMSIGAPMMSDVVVAPNTVQVGISLSDYIAALIAWAIDVALAILMALGSKGLKKGWASHTAAAEREAKAAADKAMAKASEDAIEEGLSREAADELGEAAWKKAYQEATKPSFLGSVLKKITSKAGGTEWLLTLGLKLPYRMLVQNTEWYRDDIQNPVEDEVGI